MYEYSDCLECEVCGSCNPFETNPHQPQTVKCKRCGAIYTQEIVYPQAGPTRGQIIGGAVSAAFLAAILGSAAYGKFPPKTREEAGPLVGSLIASGFAGMLTGFIVAGVD